MSQTITISLDAMGGDVGPPVVIGGSMARVGEHLIAGVREAVYTRSMPLATEHLAIVQSTTGPKAAILGASMLAAEYALSPEGLSEGFPVVR